MLSFGLKIAWFALSLSGLVSCWVVLLAFAAAVGSYWGPILYCIACTMLQGVFCIGMVWKMNPFLMPKAFCIAQCIIIGFSTFLLTGICATLSLATSLCVFKPNLYRDANLRPLAWRNRYIFPLVLFPLLASAAHVTVIFLLDAVHPSDDMHCEATDPIWVRFLSYAGTPFLLLLPSFILTALSIHRATSVRRFSNTFRSSENLPNHLQESMDTTGPPLTSLPMRRARTRNTPTPLRMTTRSGRAPIQPGFASPVLSAGKFHLPFSPPPLPSFGYGGFQRSSSRTSTAPDLDDWDSPSPVSSAYPTFAATTAHPAIEMSDDDTTIHDWRDLRPGTTTPSDYDRLSSLRWARDDDEPDRNVKPDVGLEYKEHDDDGELSASVDGHFVILGTPDENQPSSVPHSSLGNFSQHSRQGVDTAPNITPALWRIILFQLLFSVVIALASISTIVDVVNHPQAPTPFGTQHVALLLAGWGPTIVFGHLPSVQRHLFFRRANS